MKILHTSDWHLGKMLGNESLKESFENFFRQLYELIDKYQAGAVIVAGDIYDSSVSNAEAIGLYTSIAREICLKRNCHLIIIAGNHDGPERLAACNDLLDLTGLHIRGRLSATTEPVLLDEGKVAVYPVPFFNKQEVASFFPDEKITSQQDAAQVYFDAVRGTMDRSRFNIAVSHALVSGYQLSDSDHAASIGGSTEISASVFEGFDYVALGHIHKPVSISDNVRYSGSPLKFCFGEKEENQTKGMVLLDTETGESEFLPVPLLRDVRTVQGSYEELLEEKSFGSDYLFLRLTDRRANTNLYNEMKHCFPGLVELRGREMDDVEKSDASITMEQIETMDEMSIMKQFFADMFEYDPSESQLELFNSALNEIEKGGEKQ